MPLAAGQPLSFYEILGPLGAGGMGEVYLARDTRLDREVAIKVLPEELADDEERLRRFEREAKTLASLNHPNVAGIHGIDQVDDTAFIAMELVPGEDLEIRLSSGALPVVEAIETCRQIAEGLEAAHEAGVVHRDLKPANVRVTPDGVVKVLDFGLAKPMGSQRSASGAPSSQPDSFLMTEEGLILGTPTYMSPEQARGRSVDRRTDVWAFGCVLFECLTGQRPFAGESTADVMASIVSEEPDWTRLPAAIPARVVELLRRCLDKDPRSRLRDIGEARLTLESPEGGTSALEQTTEVSTSARSASSLPWVLSLLSVAALLWVALRPVPSSDRPALEVTRFTVDIPVSKGVNADRIAGLALSADGRTLAVGVEPPDKGLFVRDLDSLELRTLAESEIEDLCFSPDGRWIAYRDGDLGQLLRVRLDGSAPLTVAALPSSSGLSWSSDGYIAFGQRWGLGLARVAIGGGDGAPLVAFEPELGERHHLSPFFIRDSQVLLFTVWTGGRWNEARIVAYDIESDAKHTLPVNGSSASFVPLGDGTSGALVWAIASTLWAQRFDPAALELFDDPVQVLDGVRFETTGGEARYAVSESGTLAYVPGGNYIDEVELAWLDRDGTLEQAFPETGPYNGLGVSDDGTRAIFGRAGTVYQIVTLDLSRPLVERRMQRQTFDADSAWASISRDGKSIAYSANPDGEYRLYIRSLEDASPPRRIFPRDVQINSWTSDGRKLLMAMVGDDGNRDTWYLDLDDAAEGDLEARSLVATRAAESDPQVSPDDRWVAYEAQADDGQTDIHLATFPDGVHVLQVTHEGGVNPRWSADGSELFFRTDDGAFHVVDIHTESVPRVGSSSKLFEGSATAAKSFDDEYAVGPDDRLLVLENKSPDDEFVRVVVVENWAVELEAMLAR